MYLFIYVPFSVRLSRQNRWATQVPYSCRRRPNCPELSPPHWRRKSGRGFRSTLKAIITKDLQNYSLRSSPPERTSGRNRPVMRMKDSDDYITARAANPRTGLISPSIGSPSPRPPATPDSPADALKRQHNNEPHSPTLDVQARPALRRTHVPKRPNQQSVPAWVVDDHGWLTDTSLASPRVTAVAADAQHIWDKSPTEMSEDAFVVHMPSAREPQPYAYPGYSARQIAACEQYGQQPHPNSDERRGGRVTRGHQGVSDGYRQISQQIREAMEADPAAFAPFSSPRTPHDRGEHKADTAMRTISQPRQHDHQIISPISRKPARHTHRERQPKHHTTQGASSPRPATTTPPPQADLDLRHLPRVRLLHPSLASATGCGAQEHSNPDFGHRQCSLGCLRDTDTNLCVQPRLASGSSVTTPRRVLFDDGVRQPNFGSKEAEAQPSSLLVEILVMGIIGVVNVSKQVRMPPLPRFCALDILSARSATPREKANALEILVATAGQAVLFLMLAALVWQVGSALVRCLQLLCWPLLVSLKMMRWVCLGF